MFVKSYEEFVEGVFDKFDNFLISDCWVWFLNLLPGGIEQIYCFFKVTQIKSAFKDDF